MKKLNLLWLLVPTIFLFASCGGYTRFENPVSQEEIDHNAIVDHLTEGGVSAKKTDSGLFYTITQNGNGKKASEENGDHMKIHFKAYQLDSTRIESTYDRGDALDFTFPTMFPALKESVNLLSETGKGTFYMPSGIAFGPQGIPGIIPPNTPAVFEVELVAIKDSLQVAEERAEAEAKAKAEAAAQAVKDEEIIQKYIADNKIKAEKTPEGVYYMVEKAGGAQKPTVMDEVTVHYTGTLLDGTKFDSSRDRGEPATFPLGRVVPGWQIGIPQFGVGGKGKLIIPSGLAYGPNPAPGGKIPANSVLLFDIEVVKILDAAAIAKRNEEQRKKQEEARAAAAKAAEAQKGKDDKILQQYFKDNNLTPEKTPEGVYYIVEEAGEGEKPTLQSKVTVHYEGTLLNGTKFDSSFDRGEPTTFPLGGVVPGWQIGIPLFAKGGKGKVFIPSGLAYGARGAGKDIPPNSCLIFRVELVDFTTPKAE